MRLIFLTTLAIFSSSVLATPQSNDSIDILNLSSVSNGTAEAGKGIVIESNESSTIDGFTEYCPSGYTLIGQHPNSTCKATSAIKYSCNAGETLKGKVCTKEKHECRYNSKNSVTKSKSSGWCGSNGTSYVWDGRRMKSGYTKGKRMSSHSYGSCKGTISTTTYQICGMAVTENPANKSCPSGLGIEGDKCIGYKSPKYKPAV